MAFDEAVARGSDALKSGKLDVAQQLFREALEAEPDNVRVLALLGLTYFRGNQFAEARPIYEALVEKAATDASHRLNLGLVYLKLNESDKAINSLEASRALDPSQGRAVSYLGLAYARAGRYAEAYRSFLLAGQNELAIEIEINLTASEREGIHSQLGRTPHGPLGEQPTPQPAVSRTPTPQPVVARTASQPGEPRAKPPSAPPPKQQARSPEVSPAFADQLSHPEIVIEKGSGGTSSATMVPARSGASVVDPPPLFSQPAQPTQSGPAQPTGELRMSESMQFVLPKADAPEAVPGVSMISQAVAIAAPAASASTAARTKAGGVPPRPLSELATDELLRPEEGDDPFEIAPSGALIIRVVDRMFTRLDGVHITGGDLGYELAMRRSRGHQTEEKFDYGGTPLHAVGGRGYLIATPGTRAFSAVILDDDIVYLREDLVFAFESSLRWESGNVPGLRGKLPVVQFRGDGALAVRTVRPLVRVKLPANGVVFVDADRVAGWIGRVIPRAVASPINGPMGQTCVECTGEGIVLVEPAPEPSAPVAIAQASTEPAVARAKPPTPPPAPATPPPIDPELDMSSVFDDGTNGDSDKADGF